jgi:hypothetical protein
LALLDIDMPGWIDLPLLAIYGKLDGRNISSS